MAGYIPRWFTRPQTVRHPSTNRARRRVTSMIEKTLYHISQPDNLGIKCQKSKVIHANWSAKKTQFGGVDDNEVLYGDLTMRRKSNSGKLCVLLSLQTLWPMFRRMAKIISTGLIPVHCAMIELARCCRCRPSKQTKSHAAFATDNYRQLRVPRSNRRRLLRSAMHQLA